jgi:putative N6-adenine-specific DNA methylase
MSFDFFLPCPRGLEASLAAELAEIAAKHLNGAPFTAGAQVPGGVHFRGGWPPICIRASRAACC